MLSVTVTDETDMDILKSDEIEIYRHVLAIMSKANNIFHVLKPMYAILTKGITFSIQIPIETSLRIW